MQRRVFFISDGTGLTAEALGNSLLSQFEGIDFISETIPYVDSADKAHAAAAKINQCNDQHGEAAVVIATIVDPQLRSVICDANAVVFDLFAAFLQPLETELKTKSSYTVGRSHSVSANKSYEARIHAVNYALANDDGIGIHNYQDADLIVIGVSRSGKTPTCLYLALHFGILVANYPLTEDDWLSDRLPESLQPFKHKLFGLIISPERLRAIRDQRRPNSTYASISQCQREIKQTSRLYQQEGIPFLDSTAHSIEELATKILAMTGITRRTR